MCLYPNLILNRKYLPNKKNNFNPPTCDDERKKYVPVGCGKCIECMKQKANEWRVRLSEEIRDTENNYFITLTIDDDSYESIVQMLEYKGMIDDNGYSMQNEVATKAVRLWLERIRWDTGKSVKHWIVTELGGNNTERVHLHGILFECNDIDNAMSKWKYGQTFVGSFVSEKTINYITKYCNKPDQLHKAYKPKVLASKGIGARYLDRIDSKSNAFRGEKTNETYKTRTGIKTNLPIYYRNKIYSEEERELLWVYKLDKEERWVCGERIDISQDESEYYKVRDWYRKINEELGYGNDEIGEDEYWYKRRRAEIRKNVKNRKTLGK